MHTVKQDTAARAAKWAAVATLVLAALYTALLSVVDDPERDEPSILLFIFIGVGCLALAAPVVCVVTCIVSRLQRRAHTSGENHA